MDVRYQRTILMFILLIIFAGTLSTASSPLAQPLTPTVNASSLDMSNTSPVINLIGFVNEAVVYSQRFGKEAALKEFSRQNGSFIRGDEYIWAYDFNGVNLAHPWHPEFVGENKLNLTDPTGLRMIEAMRNEALNGSGFVRYQYENPVTGIVEPKLAYVKRVDDNWWLASGIYGAQQSLPDQSPEIIRELLEQRVDIAIRYAQDEGRDKALTEFNHMTGPFITNGSYIFAFDMNGTTLALPFLPEKIGTNERNLTDINGVSIGGEKLMVARNGGGFFYYVFSNPDADGKPELKISYIKPVDENWVIGTGTYLSYIPVDFNSEKQKQLVSKVREAASYVRDQGREEAIREFNDPNGTFSEPDMFIFAFDNNGTLLSNPYLPGLVGKNRLTDRDPYGKYPVSQLIANAENGGGFTYYFFADPGSEYRIRLKLGYSEMAANGIIVGAGIFPEE